MIMIRSPIVPIVAVCACVLALRPSASHADVLIAGPASGPYVGAAFGRFDLRIDNLNDVGTAVDDVVHSSHDAFRADVGWRFLPFLALEADYMNFGSSHDTFVGSGSNGDYNLHLSGFAPMIVGTL